MRALFDDDRQDKMGRVEMERESATGSQPAKIANGDLSERLLISMERSSSWQNERGRRCFGGAINELFTNRELESVMESRNSNGRSRKRKKLSSLLMPLSIINWRSNSVEISNAITARKTTTAKLSVHRSHNTLLTFDIVTWKSTKRSKV